jgi:penicillin-binding protein-related factor A (putative recombinase)
VSLQPQLPGIRTSRDVLDEMDRPARTNFKNDGKGFESEIAATAEAYERAGIARLQKVDPPVRVFWKAGKQQVIFLKNPWLDFAGVFTKRGGRALFVEAKSIEVGRLKVDADGGLSSTQWSAMKSWRRAGAACCVLWRKHGEVRLYVPEMIQAALDAGDRSLVFEAGVSVPQGQGMVIWDFLSALEYVLWPAIKG